MEQDEEKVPKFALILGTKSQQTRTTSHTIMSLVIVTIRPFEHDVTDKSKKWEAKAEMREKRLLLNVDRHFNPTEDASSSKTVLSESAMKDGVPKKR